MHKHLLLFVFICSASIGKSQGTNTFAVTDTAKTTLAKIVERLTSSRKTIEEAIRASEETEIRRQAVYDSVLKVNGETVAKLKYLEDKINVQAKNDSAIKLGQKQAADAVLDGMVRGGTMLTMMTQITSISLNFGVLANPWSDKNFRSIFDRFKDYTPVLGLIGAGTPLLIKGTDPKIAIGTGIGAMLIPQLVSWIAKPITKKIGPKATDAIATSFNKVQFLAQTRSAYDFLNTKLHEAKDIEAKYKSILAEAQKTQTDFKKISSPTKEQTAEYINKTRELYLSYVNLNGQFPAIFSSMKNFLDDPKNKALFQNEDATLPALSASLNSFTGSFQENLKLIEAIDGTAKYSLFGSY